MSDLQIKFTGKDMRPNIVRARDLADVIRSYEDAVVSIAARQNPEIKKDILAVSLTDIQEGSAVFTLDARSSDIMAPAADRLTEALQSLSFSDLPEPVFNLFSSLRTFARSYGCVAHISSRLAQAVIDENSEPVTAVVTSGQTTLYGMVRRVGGRDPVVWLRKFDDKVVICQVTVEQCKYLANFLYEEVGLKGTASWFFGSGELKSFKVEEVLPYRKTSPVLAFRKLREEFGDSFDSIDDPEQFVAEVRGN